jgi:hypothetical protein
MKYPANYFEFEVGENATFLDASSATPQLDLLSLGSLKASHLLMLPASPSHPAIL